jgi:hypothetical protein
VLLTKLIHAGGIMLKMVTQNQFLQKIEIDYQKLPRYTPNVLNVKPFDIAKALEVAKEDLCKYSARGRVAKPIADF